MNNNILLKLYVFILYFIIIQIKSLEYNEFNFTIQSNIFLDYLWEIWKHQNKIYLGNNIEKGIYDSEKNEFIKKINNLSKCHMGPVCPLLMFDETDITNIHILFHLNINFIIVIQMMNNIMNELIYFENRIPFSLSQYNLNEFI